MDFTKMMEITGMTMKELHKVPRVALETIIATMEKALEENYFTATKRAEDEYQIACYKELMLTAR